MQLMPWKVKVILKLLQADVLLYKAASGMGRESAIQLAIAGASGVIFADLDFAGAQEAAEESRKYATHSEYKAVPAHLDVGDEESVLVRLQVVSKESLCRGQTLHSNL